jgi:hypothetical protein
LAYVYLALPAVLFAVGWLKWWWLVAVLIGLGIGLWRMWRQAPKLWLPAINRRTAAVALVGAGILALGVVFSGIGGISWQHGDHQWRNSIFEMLVTQPWPVVIETPAGAAALTYYFGFWLPAALVGKAFGIGAGWAALLAWTWLGLAVFCCLVMGLLRRFAIWPVVLLAFFGGMDVVEKAVWGTLPDFRSGFASVEWIDDSFLYAYTAFGDQLTTVFNQAIPAWILTALVFAQRDSGSIIALCALGAIECPLPVLGLGVIAVAWVVALRDNAETINALIGEGAGIDAPPGGGQVWARLRSAAIGALTVQNVLIGAISLVVFGPFFMSSLSVSEFTTHLPQDFMSLDRLVVFWLFEFGAMFALVSPRLRRLPVWWAALATMVILPLLRFGHFNDLAMRAVIPAQVALYLMVCWTLVAARRPWRSLQAATLVVVLVLGSGSVMHKIAFHGAADYRAVQMIANGSAWRLARETLTSRLRTPWRQGAAWREDTGDNVSFWRQYFGDLNSFFYSEMSRADQPSP